MNYKDSGFYLSVSEGMPPLNKIEGELRVIDPSAVSMMIHEEPETVFLVDYYFRLFERNLAARIINHEEFTMEALQELYNCQVIRFYRANIHKEDNEAINISLGDTYWGGLNSSRLMELLKMMMRSGKSVNISAIMILQELNSDMLAKIQQQKEFRSKAMMELFQRLGGDLLGTLAGNLDLFDFIYGICMEEGDSEFLTFLDEYTKFIVQLRVAQTIVEDSRDYVDEKGMISLRDLFTLLDMVPDDALDVTMELLFQRGYIDKKMESSIKKLRSGSI